MTLLELHVPKSFRTSCDSLALLSALEASAPKLPPDPETIAAVEALERHVQFALELLSRLAAGRCTLRLVRKKGLVKSVASKDAFSDRERRRYMANLPPLPEGCKCWDGTAVWLFGEDLELPFPVICRHIIQYALMNGPGPAPTQDELDSVIGIFERAWSDAAKVMAAIGGHWYFKIGREGEVLIRSVKKLSPKARARYWQLRVQRLLPKKMTKAVFLNLVQN